MCTFKKHAVIIYHVDIFVYAIFTNMVPGLSIASRQDGGDDCDDQCLMSSDKLMEYLPAAKSAGKFNLSLAKE